MSGFTFQTLTASVTPGNDFQTMLSHQADLAALQATLSSKLGSKKEQAAALTLLEKLQQQTPASEFAQLLPPLTLDLAALTHDAKFVKIVLPLFTKTLSADGVSPVVLGGFLQPLLSAIEATPGGKWKVKVFALQALSESNLLEKLATTKQIQPAMARLVQTLVACSKEVRAEITGLAKKLLASIGSSIVKCAEIKGEMAEKLIGCLQNPALARPVLTKIVNTTFLSQIDAASFALLFPIVLRALKEKQFESKKYGLMICASAVVLLNDAVTVLNSATGGKDGSYLDTLLPMLKDLCMDPGFEIQRESAKALAAIGQEMPEVLEKNLLPWVLAKLSTDDGSCGGGSETSASDRSAAAYCLAETLQLSPDAKLIDRVLADIVRPRCLGKDASSAQKRGAFQLIANMAKKVDGFERRCLNANSEDSAFSWALAGLRDASCAEDAFAGASSIIYEYGQRGCDSLLPALTDALISFEPEYRPLVMTLLRQLIVRSAEGRKYGTDMMTDENITPATRHLFAVLLQITRVDPEAELRRQSGKVLEEQVQSLTKAKKETRASLVKVLAELKCSVGDSIFAQRRRAVAEHTIAEKTKDDAAFAEEVETAAQGASKKILREIDWTGTVSSTKVVAGEAALLVKGVKHEGGDGEADSDPLSFGWTDLEKKTRVALEKLDVFPLEAVVSAVLENTTLDSALTALKAGVPSFSDENNGVPSAVEAALTSVYEHYEPLCNDSGLKMSDDVLCHVNNLMLMYGGGHLLLKDTTLQLCKFKRYGVVGRNGTGKTTLMNLIAKKGVPGIPEGMTSIYVKPEVLDACMDWTCKKFLSGEVEEAKAEGILAPAFAQDAEKALADKSFSDTFFDSVLEKVLFPPELRNSTIAELSGGWRMRLLIAGSMLKRADVLLLDEPTNHLDFLAVNWLCDYLQTIESAVMVISHDPFFLNRVCTDVINYNKGKLVYYEGNFDAFTKRMGISAADAEALLAGQVGVSEDGGVERAAGAGNGPAGRVAAKDDEPASPTSSAGGPESTFAPSDSGEESPSGSVASSFASSSGQETGTEDAATASKAGGSGMGSSSDKKAKIVFPIPGKVKGLTSLAKPVLEINNLTYAYTEEKGDVIKGVSSKVTMNSRIHIRGPNGAGKTTFMNLICGEVHPNASACQQKGEVARHRNCRLAYMAQQHMHHMKEFMETSPYIYIQKRYVNGYDQALQERLLSCADDKELEDRKARAKQHGKYGNMLKNLVGRQLRGKEFYYEAEWENLTDSKQNTWINMDDMRKLGCESFALAYDSRAAVGEDVRPLTQREIVKHLEQFGITEELALNRNIGMFSAGQKSKVSLAAAFWIRPHLVALDEPTNYIDLETLEALTMALQRFKGGVICISHCENFASQVCNETWTLEKGALTITKSEKEKPSKK